MCRLSHRVCRHLSQQQQEMNTLTLGLHTPAHAPPGPPDLPGGAPFPLRRTPSSHRDIVKKLHPGASQGAGAAWRSGPHSQAAARAVVGQTRAAFTSAGGRVSLSDCPVQSAWAQGLLRARPQGRLFRTRLKEQIEINAIKRETRLPWASGFLGGGLCRGRSKVAEGGRGLSLAMLVTRGWPRTGCPP